jgi:hypothetical protein
MTLRPSIFYLSTGQEIAFRMMTERKQALLSKLAEAVDEASPSIAMSLKSPTAVIDKPAGNVVTPPSPTVAIDLPVVENPVEALTVRNQVLLSRFDEAVDDGASLPLPSL